MTRKQFRNRVLVWCFAQYGVLAWGDLTPMQQRYVDRCYNTETDWRDCEKGLSALIGF